jgi:signal transduction histidine kinase/CheY-like chemotaxis protein
MLMTRNNETLHNLRQDSLIRFAIGAGLTAWISLLVSGVFMPITPPGAVPLWVLFEACCGAAIWLRRYSLRLAIRVFLAGVSFCSAGAVIVFASPAPLYLSLLIPMMASILLRRSEAVAFIAILSGAMLVIAPTHPVFRGNVQAVIVLWWLTLLIGFAAFHSVLRVLQMVLEHQTYSVAQMHAAREHRAQLMQLTQALQEAQQHLEKTNIQLRHTSHMAEESRRLKAEFAANVSHELRTPINLIVGFAEIIMVGSGSGSYREPLPSAYWRDINTIYRNARHLQSLINDVLDLSQIEVGRMTVVKEHANPRDVILEAAVLVRDSITQKGLQFHVMLPDELPKAWIDRLRIRQVILNLLGNAIRFTDTGTISITAAVRGEALHIGIADTGLGIPLEERDRVFEEFRQVEGSLSRQRGGSGLGLTLSKQFVELHGGRIWIESDGIAGNGSQFWIALPLKANPVIPVQPFSPRALPVSGEDRQFVVVDEDPAIAQLFARYTHRHRAMSAPTVSAATALIDEILPAALVIDEGTLSDDLPQNVPIIRCTMPSSQRYVQSLGIAGYLAKPVTSAALANVLKTLHHPIQSVLVVDDDQDMVRLVTHIVQELAGDMQVRKAYGGIEALEIMRHAPPDVVILDLMMDEMGGDAVIAQMKATPALAAIPVVLVSAFDIADAATHLTRGAISLEKPGGLQPVELVRCVEALVDALTPSSVPVSTKIRSVPAAS